MMGVLSKSNFGGAQVARAVTEAQNDYVAVPMDESVDSMFSSAKNILLRSFFVNV
jgi:hypothetical protein